MPELPEVETVRRGLEKVMQNACIERLVFRRKDLRHKLDPGLQDRMAGKKLARIARRGKYLVLTPGSGDEVVICHLGMSGRFIVKQPGEVRDYTPQTHDHIQIWLDTGALVIFNDPRRFGMFYALPAGTWQHHPPFDTMGPEPLGNGFHAEGLGTTLEGRKGPVKTVLMDQKVVAGMGNIYACEALYYAGLAPQRQADRLDGEEVEKLCTTIRQVLQRAIEAGGSSLRDYRHVSGDVGDFQHHFAVYDRKGRPCSRCTCNVDVTGGVQRIVQSGRSSFYCPVQQV